jgi:hypothetical protein
MMTQTTAKDPRKIVQKQKTDEKALGEWIALCTQGKANMSPLAFKRAVREFKQAATSRNAGRNYRWRKGAPRRKLKGLPSY